MTRERGPQADDGNLDARTSWFLVATLAVCFLGFPLAILLWPPTFVPYRDAFLGLAMVPALLLGLVGVWTALRSRRS